MKKKLLLIAVVALMATCCYGQRMRLRGEFKSAVQGEKLYLSKENVAVDSITIQNGVFEFALKNAEPDEYCIVRINKEGKQEYIMVYLDNCDTYLKIENSTYELFGSAFIKNSVSGNPTQLVVTEINEMLMKSIESKSDKSEVNAKLVAIAKRGDLASAFVMWKYASSLTTLMSREQVIACVDNLNDQVKQSPVGKRCKAEYVKFISLMPGAIAPDFTINTTEGNPITLSQFVKGKKVILVDFWASWCAPCRAKNPEVLKLYNQFHEKGLDVISISLDDKLTEWKKAIADDKLPWTHVSELKGRESDVCKTYDIFGIPYLYLLDGDGRILACGYDLMKQLHENVEKYCNK